MPLPCPMLPQAGEADAAISMYKKARQYEAMLRLVAEHRRESLPQAQLLVAQALAAEGSRREAERLYCEAGEWKAAVQMYRGQEAWEDALRVAKVYGGQGAAKQVCDGLQDCFRDQPLLAQLVVPACVCRAGSAVAGAALSPAQPCGCQAPQQPHPL